MNTTQRRMTAASVKAIMQKRITIPAEAAGKKVQLTVQGTGNVINVLDKDGKEVESLTEPGTKLQKKIFNVKANSAIAQQNPRNKEYLMNGLKAEKLGADGEVFGLLRGEEKMWPAHDWYNAYLNAVQISFGILLPNKVADKLSDNTDISGRVDLIETENGKLLTIDGSSISVLEPEVYGTTSFDLNELMGELDAAEEAEKAKA